MDLTSAVRDLQAEAESRMTDTCRITRSVSATDDLDPVTGLPSAGTRTVVYTGKCRVRTGGTVSTGTQRQAGSDVAAMVTPVLSVPVSAPRVVVNDRVEVLTSVNPNLLALVFTVSGLVPGSQMTAQRVSMTAVID